MYLDDFHFVMILMSGIFGLLGVIFLCIGLGFTANRNKKKRVCTAKAIATIVGFRRDTTSRNRIDITQEVRKNQNNFPVVEFVANGKPVRLTSHFGQTNPPYRVGEQVELYYDPNNYKRYYIVGDKPQKILAIVFTSVGAGMIALALCFLVLLIAVQ